MIKLTKTITPLDMKICDVNSEFFGVTRRILMENAGAHLAKVSQNILEQKSNTIKEVLIFAYKGGNGGDGLVAARHLARDYPIHVVFASDPSEISSKPTKINWQILENLNLSVQKTILKNPLNTSKIEFDPERTLILDCLLGTGVKGNLREPISSCVDLINNAKKQGSFIVSADVPTGLSTDESRPDKFIASDIIVSFHAKKEGIIDIGAQQIVANIGIPPEAEFTAGPGDIYPLSLRKKWSHKGQHGRVLVIGGSDIYSGAPALTSKAALKTEIDLITILTSPTMAPTIRSYSPNFIVYEFKNKTFDHESLSIAKNLATSSDAIIIGPGLNKHPETLKTVTKMLNWIKGENKLCVVDADGLKALPKSLNKDFILTPHAGEFLAISDKKPPTGDKNVISRVKLTNRVAEQLKATILLKGATDIISNGKKWKINVTGTPKMTTGGTGDILAGIAGGFMARTRNAFRSAVAAAFINGMAGEFAENTKLGFSTKTLLDHIPFLIKESWKFIREENNHIKQL